MLYASGELPQIGDRIKDHKGKYAKVIDIEGSRILIEWDEGAMDMEHPSDDFFLVETANPNC